MRAELLTLALIVGALTWVFRFFPIQFGLGRKAQATRLGAFFGAIAPSAIATLFIASILPLLGHDGVKNLPLLGGIAGVVGIYWWKNSTIYATVAGAATFGLIFGLIDFMH